MDNIYVIQEKHLKMFHLGCLRSLLHVHWQDKMTSLEILCKHLSLEPKAAQMTSTRTLGGSCPYLEGSEFVEGA